LFQTFHDNFQGTVVENKKGVINLGMMKADTSWVQEIEKRVDEKLREFNVKILENKDDMLTLEHYTERYMPI
jgi:hypothetical protein